MKYFDKLIADVTFRHIVHKIILLNQIKSIFQCYIFLRNTVIFRIFTFCYQIKFTNYFTYIVMEKNYKFYGNKPIVPIYCICITESTF